MWTCSRYFLYHLLLSLFAVKDADAKNAYIGSAKSFCTGGTYTSNICTRATHARNAFFAINTCIKSAGPNNTSIEGVDREGACTEGVYAIKHSRINFQSFSISEMKLFDTGYWSSIDVLLSRFGSTDIFLELINGVGDGWWSLRPLQMLYQLMSIAVNNFLNNIVINITGAGSTCIESVCVDSIGIIEYSRMHLQFFRILEIRNTGIEIWVKTDW